jgi:hypothetical protein
MRWDVSRLGLKPPQLHVLHPCRVMTATPLPGETGIPPFAIYRSKVAAWEDGTIKLLYVRLKGQGAKVLVEELPGDDPVELGNKYQLTLVRIEDGTPVPPIDMPTFPVLPEPPIEMLPPDYQKPENPIYKPEYPIGIEPPIYEKPEKPEAPIYKPGDNPNVPDRDRPQPK